ncbi:hypothetical protein GCM10009584_21300 [Ornithinimicrobium humiphilum]|uniref:Uncharacterized protein DUF3710 n=1 Tax=Ornithinimicrobium humiphilum TaxID=125288 RepID=A0A543KNB9_9MICO|nr:DUF3710 domain-containing protein [Ornithinimicrobium humiphilum]TQM96575.1 uncharacterized protein DUF3710 [Ornithinimicrobium humiphilum]
MALFGRKKSQPLPDDVEELETPARPQPAEGEPGVDRDWDRASDGPYDVSEWPDLDGRVDLGALRVPAVQGMQMRLDLEQGTGRVVGVTLGFGASQAQLQVFAAPRTMGLWDELRPDIARGLVDAGGAAEIVEGMMGKEIRARMPGRAPDGRVAFQPARFLGIDGPRWFLRVVVNGPAATDDTQLRPVLAYVRQAVVRRGDEPRPPRELLELTAPAGVVEAAAKQAQARREAAQRAAAEQAAPATAVLRTGDATGVAGIAPGAEPGRHRAPAPAPEAPQDGVPKAPNKPEFT